MLLFGYDKPFYFIERTRNPDSNEYIRVLQSDPISGTINPTWAKMKYNLRKLWNGEEDNRLIFKIYRWSEKGHHKPYGKFTTSIRKLKEGELEYQLQKIDTDEFIPKATFAFENFYIEERPSFFDFLRSGWQIGLTVAVDFTGSNGDVTHSSSLHYRNPTGQLNQYETALMSVSSILVNYDSDQLIPAYGFGGIPVYLGTKMTSHCFHLNGGENPQCPSVKGLMEAYEFSLANVSLSGPTYFAPCLKMFYDFAVANATNPIYHVIMILTDGDIHDIV